MNGKIDPIKDMIKNTYSVPQIESNSSQSSTDYLAHSIDSTVEPTEGTEVSALNPCKRLTFDGTDSQSEVSPHCVLGSAAETQYFSQSINYGVPFVASNLVVSNFLN